MNTLPPWLKKRINLGKEFFETRTVISDHSVNTVCQSSMCPNINECFSKKKATFMILGRVCTRGCTFCSVKKGSPEAVDAGEPVRIADCVEHLGLKYVIITSVTRDDLTDGGAAHYVRTVESVRSSCGEVVIELLMPDFDGNEKSIESVAAAVPDVMGHNIETVERLYPVVRREADYIRSLWLLKLIKKINPYQLTKSGMMVGLGETEEEIIKTMKDLRDAFCDILTIGQYLRPTIENHPVAGFITPEKFAEYKEIAEDMGFRHISSGPFVRSSYLAEEEFKKMEVLNGEHYTTVSR